MGSVLINEKYTTSHQQNMCQHYKSLLTIIQIPTSHKFKADDPKQRVERNVTGIPTPPLYILNLFILSCSQCEHNTDHTNNPSDTSRNGPRRMSPRTRRVRARSRRARRCARSRHALPGARRPRSRSGLSSWSSRSSSSVRRQNIRADPICGRDGASESITEHRRVF
jgi:hypothetical protein